MPRLVWSLSVILGRKGQSSVLFPESKVAGRHFISVRFQSPVSLITLRQSLSSVIAPVTIPGRRRPLVTIPADVASTIPVYRRLSVTISTNVCHSPFLVAPGFHSPFPFAAVPLSPFPLDDNSIPIRRHPLVFIPTCPPSHNYHSHSLPVPPSPFPLSTRPRVTIPTRFPSLSLHSHLPPVLESPFPLAPHHPPTHPPSRSPHSRPPLAKGFHSTPGCVGHL